MARLRLTLLLSLVCLANTLVIAQYSAYNYGFDVKKRAKRQLGRRSTMVVQEKADGDIQVRQEIRQVEKDEEMWTLYILGLSMLQYTDQASPMSYYGLAGLWFFRYCTWLVKKKFLTVGHRDTRNASPELGRRGTGHRQ